MSFEEQLNNRLKEAMRAKDQRMMSMTRMVKSRMQERITAKGFSGEKDDALWQDVVESYAKSQKKALEQYTAIGAPAQEHIDQITWELEALQEFLPKKADEATLRGWIQETIDGLGGAGKANIGRVMGAVMKAHKGEADAADVRKLAEEMLKA